MSKQSDALREFFESNGILQRDVCEATGMRSGTVSNILSGRFQISKNAARKLSQVYGFSIPYLITGDGNLVESGAVHIRHVEHVQNSTINQGDGSRDAEVAMLREQLDREREARSRAEAQVSDLTEIIANLTKK